MLEPAAITLQTACWPLVVCRRAMFDNMMHAKKWAGRYYQGEQVPPGQVARAGGLGGKCSGRLMLRANAVRAERRNIPIRPPESCQRDRSYPQCGCFSVWVISRRSLSASAMNPRVCVGSAWGCKAKARRSRPRHGGRGRASFGGAWYGRGIEGGSSEPPSSCSRPYRHRRARVNASGPPPGEA